MRKGGKQPMRRCGDDCYPICDFCTYYDFNGNRQGAYTGDGFCRFHDAPREPWDGCEEFVCFVLEARPGDSSQSPRTEVRG